MHKYLFIHIPKTAGVKIRHNIHMNSNYPNAKICVQEEGFDLRFMTDAELQDYDIISGHFGYGLRRRVEPTRRCVTVLRDPLQRFISTYFYWKTLAGTYLSQLAHTLSIYEFAASQDSTVVEYVDNAQTWQMLHDFLMPSRQQFAKCSPAEIIAGAKRNLRSLDFVGIQKDMIGTLAKMKETFSWEWTDEPGVWINKTPDYDVAQIDLGRLKEQLGDRLTLDEELYALGTELYNRR